MEKSNYTAPHIKTLFIDTESLLAQQSPNGGLILSGKRLPNDDPDPTRGKDINDQDVDARAKGSSFGDGLWD